jgi:RNA polymerase sigma factor, sigma-70 family
MKPWFELLRSPMDDLDESMQRWVYRMFYQMVYKDIHHMLHDCALAQDIVQEAFLKAATQGPKLQSDATILCWIRRIARNTAIDFMRKRKRDRMLVSYDDAETIPCDISVTAIVESRIRDELLHEALAELRADYRLMLHLFYWEGKSYREICRLMHVTETALTQRMARARKRLARLLQHKWQLHQ